MRLTRTPARPRHHRRLHDRIAVSRREAASRARLHTCSGPHQQTADNGTPPASDARRGRRQGMQCRALLLIAELVALMVLASGATAHAAGVNGVDGAMVLAIAGSVDEVLTNIRNWLMGILAALATVFLTIGGVRRVFGGGDPGEQEKAKECFKAAGIGYALAALAPLVVTVLKGIVGA